MPHSELVASLYHPVILLVRTCFILARCRRRPKSLSSYQELVSCWTHVILRLKYCWNIQILLNTCEPSPQILEKSTSREIWSQPWFLKWKPRVNWIALIKLHLVLWGSFCDKSIQNYKQHTWLFVFQRNFSTLDWIPRNNERQKVFEALNRETPCAMNNPPESEQHSVLVTKTPNTDVSKFQQWNIDSTID